MEFILRDFTSNGVYKYNIANIPETNITLYDMIHVYNLLNITSYGLLRFKINGKTYAYGYRNNKLTGNIPDDILYAPIKLQNIHVYCIVPTITSDSFLEYEFCINGLAEQPKERLYAFWEYDLPPYIKGDEVVQIKDDYVTTKNYPGFEFKYTNIVPYDDGIHLMQKIITATNHYKDAMQHAKNELTEVLDNIKNEIRSVSKYGENNE